MRDPESAARIVEVLRRADSRDTAAGTLPPTLAGLIDHTLLGPDAGREAVRRLCEEAIRFEFAAVCVNPSQVSAAATHLGGTRVLTVSVAGFPLGASRPEIKLMEAVRALEDGAAEVDMVQNVGALKDGDLDLVRGEIARIAGACRERGGRLKVILEIALLTDEEKVVAAWAALEAGADFVKTSTGFGPGGATVRDVRILCEAVGPRVGVKASGGIRTLAQARALVRAGAVRLGTSGGVRLLEEERAEELRP